MSYRAGMSNKNGLLFRLALICLDKPRATLLAGLMVVLLLASGLPLLELRTDGQAIYPTGNPIVERSKKDAETFKDSSQVIVLISAKPGGARVTSAAGLLYLKQIDESLRHLPVVHAEGIRTLATLKNPYTRDGALSSVAGYLDKIPSDPIELEKLLAQIKVHPIAQGLFISHDGSTAALYVTLAQHVPRWEAVDALEKWLGQQAKPKFDLRLTGPVVAEVSLGRKVLGDLKWTIPIMLLVIAALLFRCLRTRGAVLVVLAEISAVLICALGMMGYLGIPITLITTIMPIVLLTMAVADEIHFLDRLQLFQEESDDVRKDRRSHVSLALRKVERPMILTSLTTAAGFLAFPASDIAPLRDFGFLAAGGILIALLSSFTLIPALVVTMPCSWWRSIRHTNSARRPSLFGFEEWICRHEFAAFGLGVGLVAASVPGAFLLSVQDSWIDNFDSSSAVSSAHRVFNNKFWGAYRFDVVLSSQQPQFFRQREGLGLIEEVVQVASSAPHSGGVVSYLTSLQMISDLTGKERIGTTTSLEDLRTLNALAILLRRRLDIEQLLTRDASSTRIRVHVKDDNYRHALELQKYLERGLAPLLAKTGVEAHFSGDLPIAVEVVRAITTSQLSSIAWSVAGIGAILLLFLRSLRLCAVTLAPVIGAAALMFGTIGYLHFTLGVASSMFMALSIGSGIDFSLHLIHSYSEARNGPVAKGEVMHASFSMVARSVRWNAMTLGLGFLVLALSSLKPNRILGLLLCAAMLAAYLTTVLLLPYLLSRLGGIRQAQFERRSYEEQQSSADCVGYPYVPAADLPLCGSAPTEGIPGVCRGRIRALNHHDTDHIER